MLKNKIFIIFSGKEVTADLDEKKHSVEPSVFLGAERIELPTFWV